MADTPQEHQRRVKALMTRLRKDGRLPNSVEVIREAFEVMGYTEWATDTMEVMRQRWPRSGGQAAPGAPS
jgi:hypothetical protein